MLAFRINKTVIVFFLFVSIIAIPKIIRAQGIKKLTLEEAIDIALKNNIDLQRAKNNSLIASSNKRQAILNYLPSLNARANYDYFFGTFFDTNAARQVSETTNSSGPRISSELILFNGFERHNNRRRRENEFEASVHNIEHTKQIVQANVIASYLNAVADRENIKISENRIDLLLKQLDREEKREEAGVGKLEEVYNLKSQVASEKLNLVVLENQYVRNKLILIQALQLENPENYEIAELEIPENDLEGEISSFGDIMETSRSYSPDLKRANYNLQASKNGFSVAKAARYPTITVFGQIGSNYSSNGARNPTTGEFEDNAKFIDQLEFNQYEYVNFSLNIPIFTRGVTSNNIQVAKINVLNAELDLKQSEMDLSNRIQQAYLDLVAAKSTYNAAKENLLALDQSYKFMEARYNSGNSDFYSYLESLNNKNRAEIELANARYSIAFRKKILNIYQGLE